MDKIKNILKNVPPLFYILIGVMAVILIAWAVLPMDMWMKDFNQWIKQLGVVGVIAFFVIYVVATVAMAPGAPLSIAGGLAFKAWGWARPLWARHWHFCADVTWRASASRKCSRTIPSLRPWTKRWPKRVGKSSCWCVFLRRYRGQLAAIRLGNGGGYYSRHGGVCVHRRGGFIRWRRCV